MHLSEWDADDGDTEYEAVEDVGEPYPDAANEEPQHIHENAQTAWLRLPPFHFCTERPDGQHTQFQTLQAEGDADEGMPMMVIISISPAMKYSKAICNPPNTIQMMFPNVFIDLFPLKVSIC